MTRSASSSKTDPATQYALDVTEGRIVAGPYVRAAAARHLKDFEEGQDRGLYWDPAAAQRFSDFCSELLTLGEGQFAGVPFKLHPMQEFLAGSIFGWKRADGTRRFRRAYIEQGKGNGKSPFAGALGLYGLIADGEAGAQIYAAGATREQASILFRDAVVMLNGSPSLDAVIKRSGGPGREFNLAHLASGSVFRPVSRETKKTGSGPRPHFALVDELHEHPDAGVLEILERGFKFRRQPLLLMITNSGSDRLSVCWQEREHAVRVATGEVEDDSTFAYICALDPEDDPFENEACWIKANPLLGVTITAEYLRAQVKQAKDIPARANGVRRLHFCQWTDAERGWLPVATWQAIEDSTLDLADFEGQPCYMGLDLSAKADLTAKALVFHDGEDDDGAPRFAAFVHGYTPADTLRVRAERDRAPYPEWVEAGHLTATPGEKTRLDFVAHDISHDNDRFDLRLVAYDQFLIADLKSELDALGLDGLPLVDHPQGWNKRKREVGGAEIELGMPWSVDALETLILERRIRVHVNPALRAAAMSAEFERSPADLRRFTKQKAVRRIDMLVALTMAVGAAATGDGPARSYLESEGMMFVW